MAAPDISGLGPLEVRIGMIGSVDAGKSTLTGVLANGKLDDGKGLARSSVLRHQHELDTGRTSSISHNYIQCSNGTTLTLVDLAGHERYFKTTITGMNRLLDYCCLMVGANMGVLRMTREHLISALSLDISTFVVITKYDIAPENKYLETRNDIIKFINKKTNGRRKCILINNQEDYDDYINSNSNSNINNDDVATIPIFTVSSKTGHNINIISEHFKQLEQRYPYDITKPTDFIIEQRYNLRGIGTVVSGIVKDGSVSVGDILLMGSFHRKFYEVKIKSIHNNFRRFVDKLEAGQGGCLNLKFIKEKFNHRRIKSGCHVLAKPQLYTTFKAKIKILQHPTTIKLGYEPTIHCETVSQTAKIIEMDCDYLHLGDTANVVMSFRYHPEFITEGSRILFREGATKGIGVITEIVE